jgi:hypothetical protein
MTSADASQPPHGRDAAVDQHQPNKVLLVAEPEVAGTQWTPPLLLIAVTHRNGQLFLGCGDRGGLDGGSPSAYRS